jgi:DNA primase
MLFYSFRQTLILKGFHEMLKPVTIIVPFAPAIATYIIKAGAVPIATRRAFNRMLAVVQTIACAYQYQREQDKEGRVIADMIDYYLALQIVQQAFKETLGQESYGSEERLTYIRDNGPVQYKTMQEAWGISKMAVSSWVSLRVRDGVLVFCNEGGGSLAMSVTLERQSQMERHM